MRNWYAKTKFEKNIAGCTLLLYIVKSKEINNLTCRSFTSLPAAWLLQLFIINQFFAQYNI